MVIKKQYNKLPNGLKLFIRETWPVFVLLFAITIEMRHIANTNWMQLFLYNGDSLTLAIMKQALLSKTPFIWISSSQFNIFPEGLFYAFSSIITTSIRASIVFNAYLNIVVLYALTRWVASGFKNIPNIYKRLFALSCCLLFLFYMILERQPQINFTSIATLFLFNAYYYGVILSGIAILGIMLFQYKYTKYNNRSLVLFVIGFILSALSTFSDPLFAIEFLFPLFITLIVLSVITKINPKKLLLMGLPSLLGGVVGYEIRKPFNYMIGQSSGNHILTTNIPKTITLFHNILITYLNNLPGRIELFLAILFFLFSLVYVVYWIYCQTHKQNNILDERYLMLSLLAVLIFIWAIFFSIASGSGVSRYLTPILVFPLLGLLPITEARVLKAHNKLILFIVALISLGVIVLGSLSIKQTARLLSSKTYTSPSCLSEALDNKTSYGVGSYWTIRALDVYGRTNEQAVQILPNFIAFPWQISVGEYENRHFSFVIVNKNASSPINISPSDEYLPIKPSKITPCSDFYVYQYAIGSLGYKELNDSIDESTQTILQLRANGQLATSRYL